MNYPTEQVPDRARGYPVFFHPLALPQYSTLSARGQGGEVNAGIPFRSPARPRPRK